MCNNVPSGYKLGNETVDGSKIVGILNNTQISNSVSQCRLRKNTTKCLEYTTTILTEEGVCFTFNMKTDKDLFKRNSVHKEYDYVPQYYESSSSKIDVSHGYRAGALMGFTIVMTVNKDDLDYICRAQGFKLHLHNSGELPRVSHQILRVSLDQEVNVAVKPHIMSTSEDLKDYPPER